MISIQRLMIICKDASKNIQVVHQEVADEPVTVQHDLRLFISQFLLQMLFQLNEEVVALEDDVSAGG